MAAARAFGMLGVPLGHENWCISGYMNWTCEFECMRREFLGCTARGSVTEPRNCNFRSIVHRVEIPGDPHSRLPAEKHRRPNWAFIMPMCRGVGRTTSAARPRHPRWAENTAEHRIEGTHRLRSGMPPEPRVRLARRMPHSGHGETGTCKCGFSICAYMVNTNFRRRLPFAALGRGRAGQ